MQCKTGTTFKPEYRTPLINAQCQSMLVKILALIPMSIHQYFAPGNHYPIIKMSSAQGSPPIRVFSFGVVPALALFVRGRSV